MAVIYVVGDAPGAGSTSVAAAMALIWKRAGRKVGLIKPVSLTADQSDQDFFNTISDYSDQSPTVQIQANTSDSHLIDAITNRVDLLKAHTETLIIEGLPLTDHNGRKTEGSAALTKRLNAKVVVVTTATSNFEKQSTRTWTDYYGPNFIGEIMNRFPRYSPYDISIQASGQVLGRIMEQRIMLAPTVQQIGEHLDGIFYCSSTIGEQKFVEHFLIGGLIMEWGGNYFGRLSNQAVIVRGGRIDIQMSALHFPLNCMILTDCDRPAQYVHQRAQSQGVPLLVVPFTTLKTAEALETIQNRVSATHLGKAERFAEVLIECINWESVNSINTMT
jgi:BioD-like phosphotransacetylase family protein